MEDQSLSRILEQITECEVAMFNMPHHGAAYQAVEARHYNLQREVKRHHAAQAGVNLPPITGKIGS